MKKTFLLFLMVTHFAHAGGPEAYPTCYQGQLQMDDGRTEIVMLAFSAIEGRLARIQTFVLGDKSHRYSGTIRENNVVTFNENNDYIPGGHATYNIDIELRFPKNSSESITGSLKRYSFANGTGGYGHSPPDSLVESGLIQLKKCKIVLTKFGRQCL